MCIRDRVEKIGEFTRGATVVDIHDRWGAEPNVHVATGLNAVSYTHLRAHETVLDLVCRLLLEKKKH